MEDPNGSRPWAQAAIYLALSVTALDLTIVNVALPTILRDLSGSTTDGQWIVDSYTIVLAALVLLGAGLGERFGRRRVFVAGIAVFVLGSLMAAFAPGVEVLIAGRTVMGLGAAGMMPASLSLISALFTPERRPAIVGRWATATGIALAAGPVVGGLMVAHLWWGSVFLVTVPVVGVSALIALWKIPDSRAEHVRTLDLKGAALSVLALGAMVGGLIEGPRYGWDSPEVLVALGIGLAALGLFVVTERRTETPMFDVSVLTIPQVQGGAAALFFAQLLYFATLFLVPQHLSFVEKTPSGTIGLLLVIPALGVVYAMSRTAGWCARFGARRVLVAGALILAAGCAGMTAATWLGGIELLIAGTTAAYVGIGILLVPGTTVMMNAVPVTRAGSVSGAQQVARQTGAALGVALIGSLFATAYGLGIDAGLAGDLGAGELARAARSPAAAESLAAASATARAATIDAAVIASFTDAFRLAFLTCAGLAVVTAGLIVWRIPPDPRPADAA